MNNIDSKIEKICKELEKDFNAQILRGKVYKIKEKITIPVSIKYKNQNNSPYNIPVGLIQIAGNKVDFIPLKKKPVLIKTIIKVVLIFLSILGLKSLFSSKKKWDAE